MKTTLLFFMLLAAVSISVAQKAEKKPAEKPAQNSAPKKPPVPERLLSAKTACLHFLNGSDKDFAEAKRELKNWGRFKLVEDCSAADVAVWVTARDSRELDACGAIVQVLGASDKAILWTANGKCKGKTRSYTVVGILVRRLRQDVTQAKK